MDRATLVRMRLRQLLVIVAILVVTVVFAVSGSTPLAWGAQP